MLNSNSQHNSLARSGKSGSLRPTVPSADLAQPQRTAASLAESAEAFQNLALQMLGQGNFKMAADYCNLALQAKPTGQTYKILGDSLQRLGDPQQAEQSYRQALQLEPTLAEAYANLGSLHAQQQQWLKSLLCYQKAIALKPELTALQPNLDRLWTHIRLDAAAPDQLLQAFVAHPQRGSAQSHFKLGQILLERGQTADAIACFQRSLQLNPQFAPAKQQLETLARSPEPPAPSVPPSDPAPASQSVTEPVSPPPSPIVTVVKRARKTSPLPPSPSPSLPQPSASQSVPPSPPTPLPPAPNSPAASLCRQADQAAQQQQWSTAIQHYQQAIATDPDFAVAYWHLGQVLEQTGQREAAIDRYYQALTLQPTLVKAAELRRFGDLFVQQQQFEQALNCYEWSLQQEELAATYRQIGDIFLQQNQLEAAIAPYQKAIALQPSGDHYHQLGGVYLKLEQWQSAAAAYTQATQLRPDYSWSYQNLGDVLQKLERWDEAATAYRKAIELKPDFHWSHYNLGDVLAQQEQWDEAVTAYRLAFQLQPSCTAAEQKLYQALHCRAKTDLERVQHYYQQAIEREPDNPDFFHQAIALDPRNPLLYVGLSKALLKQGEADQAKVFYQMALQLDPELKKKFLDLNSSFAW